ncbi:MAG: GNAT family N-acetyltransferase [Rubrobacter sp.]|nr:GNAT family N-acetyltransferase [Rubrobacter sp.]
MPWPVRPGGPKDIPFLWEMLYEAVCWRPGGPRPPWGEILVESSRLSRYLEEWGRAEDTAVIAVDYTDGRDVGAAWYRLFLANAPGYGFVDAFTPEVAIGVAPGWRGRGVGGTLLDTLLGTAKSQGFDALSLSVEPDNPAARLYERKGFVGLFVDEEGSWTMRAELSAVGARPGAAQTDDAQT